MMFNILIAIAILASVSAFSPSWGKVQMRMSLSEKINKAIGIAALSVSLAAPMLPSPAMADGAASKSTEYRARLKYGPRITALGTAANSGNFAAFEDKKVINGFDLFISGTNAVNGVIAKQRSATEKAIEAKIYSAVKAKDAAALKAAYGEFIKVASLNSDYKPNELGQTDSSGYSPTYGTATQYIYQR